MEYVIDNNIRVSNNSWGSLAYSQAMRDAIAASQAIGHIFVASAGNDSWNTDITPHYPSAYDLPNIISVAATDNNDALASFSNFGPTTVDLGAPGVAIYSTKPGTGHDYLKGTSMATPHVTGVAALIMSRRPDWTWQQIKNRLLAGVRPVDSLIGFTVTGGVVNAMNVGDCNQNGIADEVDITEGTSQDCTGTGIPDECEPDCNGNALADSCDILAGSSDDCNANVIPDECEPDCNNNNVADSCDIFQGTGDDCNVNFVLDECDIAQGTSTDCNTNGIPDECDIAAALFGDCNHNDLPDECDLADGTSEDCDGDLIPDECEAHLRVLVIATYVSDDFLAAIEQAGHFVRRVSPGDIPSNFSLYDVAIYGTAGRPYTSQLDLIDEFVKSGHGLIINQDGDQFEQYGGAASPLRDAQGWILREGTQVVDFASPLVTGLGPTSMLEGWSTVPTLKPQADLIMDWSDGVPMAATYYYGAGKVVYFNDEGASALGNWVGDPEYGTILMYNALDYVGVPSGDCNRNGIPDGCDLAAGTSADDLPTGGDGIPDECQSDCNDNGIPDILDVADGVTQDCQPNGLPDACDLAEGTSADCNGNGYPDECEPDCNANRIQDGCEIAAGSSEDCSANGVPDECEVEPDCNTNGIGDHNDICHGTSADHNTNGVPDECETVFFVAAGAPPGGNGTSWASAFDNLNDALAEETATEVWVAAGTYRPSGPGGDQAATFQLVNGVRVFGGFAGGETGFDERDPGANPTILSGDLNGDDEPDWTNRYDNSYHVVTGSGTDETTVLDGFIVTGGSTLDSGDAGNLGAGMLSVDGSPTVQRCVFRDNIAGVGGGMYLESDGRPAVINCGFFGNKSLTNGGGAEVRADARLINSVFSGNYARWAGGGLYAYSCEPTVANCTFSMNVGRSGGAGGVHYLGSESVMTLANCVFWGNTANGSADEAAQISAGSGSGCEIEVNYSCVQGWTGFFGGVGNFGDDPLFANAAGGDGVVGTADDDLRLLAGSPCIDAGDNTTIPADASDLDGNGVTGAEPVPLEFNGLPRLIDDPETPDTGNRIGPGPVVDLGALEYAPDCNANGIADVLDIGSGTSLDCNGNVIPDECDLALGTSEDCTGNDIPDECETLPDCNGSGTADYNDLCTGESEDCNSNGVPDECDLALGDSADCNNTGVPDECENDCNANGLADECDLANETSVDHNGNGVPDECERPTNRYLPLVPFEGASPVAYQVTLVASAYFPESVDTAWWVDTPDRHGIARLTSEPVYRDWSLGRMLIRIGDCPIVPAATYEIRSTTDAVTFSEPRVVSTIARPGSNYWADGVGPLGYFCGGDPQGLPCDPEGDPCPTGQPCVQLWQPADGFTNFNDVTAAVFAFERFPGKLVPHVTWVDLHGNDFGDATVDPPNLVINFSDIQHIVLAFQGNPYPFSDPADCP